MVDDNASMEAQRANFLCLCVCAFFCAPPGLLGGLWTRCEYTHSQRLLVRISQETLYTSTFNGAVLGCGKIGSGTI